MIAVLWTLAGLFVLVLFLLFGFAVQRDVPTYMQTKQAVTVRSLGAIAVALLIAVAAVAIAEGVRG